MPLNQTALVICADVAHHEYEGIALHLAERERLIADLGSKNAMLLWNHGTLALGRSVAECFIRMYYLERACMLQVLARGTGSRLKVVPDRIAAQTRAQMDAERQQADLHLAALKRLLDRDEPGWSRLK